MILSAPFIRRPVATTLLTVAVALAGAVAFTVLPVSPLPQVDFPTIAVAASLPGASAEIMASSVAAPLERQFGHIAGLTEMTSSSSLGTTSITMQFDLGRDIDFAARDVQAGINAARTYLPVNLPANPTYRKVNPADAPIMILGLTSNKYDRPKLYDAASTIIQQKLSQIEGVGQVSVGGGTLPSVRVEVDPAQLSSMGLTLQNVQSMLSLQNTHQPTGQISDDLITADIITNDQLSHADEYKPLVVGYNRGAAVRLSDVADVVDSTQNVRTSGYLNGRPAIVVIIYREPGANIIQTVERISAQLPSLRASIPQGIEITTVLDRTTTIRASVNDVERTLVISIVLVIIVVFLFLRSARATLIPIVAVPVSLIGTFAVMYFFGYSIDNLSLMALTISTGFVVDDAIVVMEDISRHLEEGASPLAAALQGAKEIGFTVFSISISLIAVFIPILMMAGVVGRLFREFAVVLSTAILVSMIVSLTTTPMMCAHLLKDESHQTHGRLYRASESVFNGMLSIYRRSLAWVLENHGLMLVVLLLTIALNVLLIVRIPKGFFPQQDTGAIVGGVQGPQDASFSQMDRSIQQLGAVIKDDPAVANLIAFTGGAGATNGGFIYIALKPLDERKVTAPEIMGRLRPKMARLPVASAFLQAAQDLRVGGRQSNALYQYTIQSDNVRDLSQWGPILLARMKKLPGLQDVNSDQQNNGLDQFLTYDRVTAARLGITPQSLNSTLYSAFGQSQVSIIYTAAQPVLRRAGSRAAILAKARRPQIHLPAHLEQRRHPPGRRHPRADRHHAPHREPHRTVPIGHGVLQSRHRHFVERGRPGNQRNAAESGHSPHHSRLLRRHLARLPAVAGQRALPHPDGIAGRLHRARHSLREPGPPAHHHFHAPLGQRRRHARPDAPQGRPQCHFHHRHHPPDRHREEERHHDDRLCAGRRTRARPEHHATRYFEASILRFRPILMTTMAALFGALPLAFGTGTGSELRRPLGITIVGGLIVSQLLTLYTTPVVYLSLDNLRLRMRRRRR